MTHYYQGICTEFFILPKQSFTSSGSNMRHAPNFPFCTLSDGQPTLRFISSYPYCSHFFEHSIRSFTLEPPS